ncbi:MAG: class I SAM-dependent methyltransferase [Candidatus Thorarchaeota archaeon]
MRDALKGELVEYKMIRDDGFITESNGAAYLADVSEWDHAERLSIREVQGPVLDIGCGAGRVGLYLQRKGISYTGIDISPLAIETCKLQGLNEVHVMSANSLELDRSDFRSVVMFGNNFGLLGEVEDTVRMLKVLYNLTIPEAKIFAGSRDVRHTNVPEHLAYHRRNRERNWPIGKVTLKIEYQGNESDWWNFLMSIPDEMDAIARKAGWYLEKTIGKPNYYVGILRKV